MSVQMTSHESHAECRFRYMGNAHKYGRIFNSKPSFMSNLLLIALFIREIPPTAIRGRSNQVHDSGTTGADHNCLNYQITQLAATLKNALRTYFYGYNLSK
jgi:hypothetical protein